MKAMMFYAPGDIRMEEVPTPQASEGEVLVEIGAALTCGTDVKTYRRGHPLLIPNPPSVFGHEFAGTIVGLGQGVSGFHLGQRVVAANSAPCGECFYCKEGRLSLCQNLKLLKRTLLETLRDGTLLKLGIVVVTVSGYEEQPFVITRLKRTDQVCNCRRRVAIYRPHELARIL